MTDRAPAGASDVRADAVLVAAGQSRRMAGVDKVVAEVAGLPVVAHALRALDAAPSVERIVVVTSPERIRWFQAAPWLPGSVVAVVTGGNRRQESVAAGVAALDGPPERPILVHDGARPLVSPALVDAVVRAVAVHGAAIPVLPVAETLKRIDGDRVGETVDRSGLAAAQTPQGAQRGLLVRAWAAFPADGATEFTDEAALLEACRIPVHAIPGEPANLKVTLPDDLRRVEQALARPSARVGFGHDSHPFGPGTGLRLGGLTFEMAPRLVGHSDGDVVLHAIADALLGAAGLGDLGRLFPADARTPRGIASTELLAEVGRRLASVGLRPGSVDVTVIGARPRLGVRLDDMGAAIAAVLDMPSTRVNVKASTGNLAGDEGAGRSMSARAVATVEARA